MRLRSFLTFGLGAALLLLISTAPRPSHACGAAGQDVCQKGAGVNVGVKVGAPGGASGIGSVREIDVPALRELLQPNPQQPRPLLVNFWATWCDPCREEFPDLVRIDADYRSRGLEFITISLDDTSQINTNVPQFLREKKASMPAYLLNTLDPDAAIEMVDRSWRGALPATFLYDARGQIVFKHTGRIKAEELRAAIEKVLSEK